MKTYRIAFIPGDGIGKEVLQVGQQVLRALAASQSGFGFAFTGFDCGGDYYRRHRRHDASRRAGPIAPQRRHSVRLGR